MTVYKRPKIHPFSWGKVIKVHECGRYTIVEFLFIYSNDCGNKKEGDNEIRFACYVDDRDLHHSATSFDMALLICISYRIANNGSQHSESAYWAGKLLDIDE